MQIIKDILGFIQTLSYVDIIFFFAVLSLMLLIITLIYFIKENNGEDDQNINFQIKKPNNNETNEESDAIIDLKQITKALEEAEPSTIDLNNYEVEQEEKAIISYDELLKKRNDFGINYIEEENIDENLSVKKVDLNNLLNKDIIEKKEMKVTVISYEKEEAFLQALKTLQQTLN